MTNDTGRNTPPRASANPSDAPSNNGRDARTRARSTVSYSDLDANALLQFLTAVTDAGAAVILGKTSDGGAYSLTVLDGKERIREYAHTVEEFASTIRWLVSMFSTD